MRQVGEDISRRVKQALEMVAIPLEENKFTNRQQ